MYFMNRLKIQNHRTCVLYNKIESAGSSVEKLNIKLDHRICGHVTIVYKYQLRFFQRVIELNLYEINN